MIKNYLAKEKTNSYRPKPWGWSETPFPAFRGESHSYTAFLAVANGYKCNFGTHPKGATVEEENILLKKYYPNPEISIGSGYWDEPKNKTCFLLKIEEEKIFWETYPKLENRSKEFIDEYNTIKEKPIPNILEEEKPVLDGQFSKIITTTKGTLLLVPCNEREDEKILLVTALSGFRGFLGNIEVVNGEILYDKKAQKHCVETAHIVARLSPKGYVWTETGRRSSTGDVEIFSWDSYQRMSKEEFLVWQEIQK